MAGRALKQIVLMASGLAVMCVAAYVFAPRGTLPWCVALSVFALVFFSLTTYVRRRDILRLTNEIDEVINTGRALIFADYKEDDIAVLGNALQKATDKLARLSRLLEEEKTALADALADISHQIRTPLTAAELSLASIERTSNDEERKQQIRKLELLLERISWLVTALMKIAKADAGALTLSKQRVYTGKAVRRALCPLETSLDLRGINLQLKIDEKASFLGDEIWSAEAIENIIKNAMESTPEGGTITISSIEDALACRITIDDSGEGISEEDLPHLFERFYRGKRKAAGQMPCGAEFDCDMIAADCSSSSFAACSSSSSAADSGSPSAAYSCSPLVKTEGFGIGLSLARALISAQGGSLRAENLSDAGARFTIVFPKSTV